MELFSVLCGRLYRWGVWGRMDSCICMNESLCCSLQTIRTLSIGYTLIQNKKLKKNSDCSLRIFTQFSSVQFLSRVQLFATPWITECQASLSITNYRSLLKVMSIESVMPFSHLILCRSLLLLLPIPPSIRVFSNESTLHMRWPKYWSFSFSISPSNEHPGLISFRMDWLDLLAVQVTLKSLLQHHSSKASVLQHSTFFSPTLTSISVARGHQRADTLKP